MARALDYVVRALLGLALAVCSLALGSRQRTLSPRRPAHWLPLPIFRHVTIRSFRHVTQVMAALGLWMHYKEGWGASSLFPHWAASRWRYAFALQAFEQYMGVRPSFFLVLVLLVSS